MDHGEFYEEGATRKETTDTSSNKQSKMGTKH
jgi:hypothetical protein